MNTQDNSPSTEKKDNDQIAIFVTRMCIIIASTCTSFVIVGRGIDLILPPAESIIGGFFALTLLVTAFLVIAKLLYNIIYNLFLKLWIIKTRSQIELIQAKKELQKIHSQETD